MNTQGAETLGDEYTSDFFTVMSDGSRASARVIVPLVIKMVNPASVLDVGCGAGAWLSEWINHGVADAMGLDGDYVKPGELLIDQAKFVPTDLRQPFSAGRKFDIVQCLEVAEHLETRYTEQFMDSLTSHGDVILFSAAIPGQGGTHHVNEQWPSYWIEKFARRDFTPYDVIRPVIWSDPRINTWYRQNILLFAKSQVFEPVAESTPFDVVHPESWRLAMDLSLHPETVVRQAPSALWAVMRDKLRRGK